MPRTSQRVSVGSTEAANEVVARFGVVGPEHRRAADPRTPPIDRLRLKLTRDVVERIAIRLHDQSPACPVCGGADASGLSRAYPRSSVRADPARLLHGDTTLSDLAKA
jgi:hypothetical protein